jgi:hypothetical protein
MAAKRKMKINHLTFRSPHHIKGLSEFWLTNSKILLSHFLLLWNEFASSFHPLFGTYVFNKRSVSNSIKITRPSGSCFEAKNKNKNEDPLAVNQELNIIQCKYIKKKNYFSKYLSCGPLGHVKLI